MSLPTRFLSAAFASLLLVACSGARGLVTEPHALVSQPSPTDSGLALDGREVKVPAPGKVTLIDFWQPPASPASR